MARYSWVGARARVFRVLRRAGLWAAFGCTAAGAELPVRFHCLPTCSEVDGKMLSLAGAGLSTLGGNSIEVKVISSGGGFRLDIFDGDTGAGNPPHWDRVPASQVGAAELRYRLLADPDGNGAGAFDVGPEGGWRSNAVNPSQGEFYVSRVQAEETGVMADDQWFEISIEDAAEAYSTGGGGCPPSHYCYRLRVTLNDTGGAAESNFKLRAGTDIRLLAQAFSVVGGLRTPADARIVYPHFDEGDLTLTHYDGRWRFDLRLETPAEWLAVWDGDFDFGSWDCRDRDAADPDTCTDSEPESACRLNHRPGYEGERVPPWAVGTAARTEGVAFAAPGVGCPATGAPPDDMNPDTLIPLVPPCAVDDSGVVSHCFMTRPPSVRYRIETPIGSFLNSNPSGNQEWEQFRLDTNPLRPADFHVDRLPAGRYSLVLEGLDPANLVALRLFGEVSGLEAGSLGGTVWLDSNRNGRRDPSEPGIEQAEVILFRDSDGDGRLQPAADRRLGSQTTSRAGGFLFPGLGAGLYFIDVVEDTLPPGLALTTANEPYNLPVGPYHLAEGEVHRVDFGYFAADPPGVRTVGFWKNHPSAWPVQLIRLGEAPYPATQVLQIMSADVRGDKSIDLFRQLAAAKLNAASGNDWACVSSAVEDADRWLTAHPPGSSTRASDPAWRDEGEMLKNLLDAYNNGRLECAA